MKADTAVEAIILMQQQLAPPKSLKGKSKSEKGLWVYSNGQELAQNSQQRLIDYCDRAQISFQTLTLVNALFITATAQQLLEISTFPEVKYIGSNIPLKNHTPVTTNARNRLPSTWGLDTIRATLLHLKGITGKNVVVGGQDTGYDWTHPALMESYRGYSTTTQTATHSYNWHDAIKSPIQPAPNPCGRNIKEPCDDIDHGTHTMGTVTGQHDSIKIGVAPGAKWIGCRNMDQGFGSLYTYLDCFNWFLAPTDTAGQQPNSQLAPHVIVNSWGCIGIEGCNISNFEVLRIAVSNLRTAGVVVVASAGNSGNQGCGSIDTPAAIYGESFVVGASDEQNRLAGFSSKGPVTIDSSNRMKPDVVAPGTNILSSILNQQYDSYSGTSMSGPHVAGAVALLIEADSTLAGQPDSIETLLKQTAQPLRGNSGCGNIPQGQYPNHETGHGLINLWEALKIIRPDLTQNVATGTRQPKQTLKLFPNPAHNQLNISIPPSAHRTTLGIYNLTGKLMLQHTFNTQGYHTQDISSIPSGAYIVVLQNKNNYYSSKLFKY